MINAIGVLVLPHREMELSSFNNMGKMAGGRYLY